VLALAFDNSRGEGDVVYQNGSLLASGYDLETAIIMSLFCDAPAQDGDVLADGTSKRGYWADVYDEEGNVLGSRLWLLESEPLTQGTAQRAEVYSKEALNWLVAGRYVRAISTATELGSTVLLLTLTVTLRDGNTVQLGPFKVAS
jgi:phage gp46-like protein